MVVKNISLSDPFPDTCGWNQAMEYESQWHLQEALKEDQSAAGGAYHFAATFLYHLPLVSYACYLITYVALAAIRPDWLSRMEEAKRAPFEKRGAIEIREVKTPPPRDTPRPDYHRQMAGIFRRQEKKNVLLTGPPGVGKTKIAETYPSEFVHLSHFEVMPQEELEKFLSLNNGKGVLCACRPIPHEELVRRYCTVIEVKEPSDEMTKKIVKGRFPFVEETLLNQALELCRYYLPNKSQPGLLFDVIDGTYSFYQELTLEKIREHLHQMVSAPIRTPEERSRYYASAKTVLKEKVLGQDHVICEVAKILENCGNGLWPTGIPILHFAGPTGVGKTELAKAIAHFFFEGEEKFLHVSMAQYGEKHAVSALTGTTPGFVGFEMGGQIQEKAKKGPFVLLLDEAEKSHPDVITNLIQHVAEEGTLYDPKTQSDISLKGSLIILTTNLGSQELERSQIGWRKKDLSNPDEVKAIVRPAIERHFRPDLIGRLQTFYFTPHTDLSIIRKIVLKFLTNEQRFHRCTLTWTDDYVDAFTNMEKIEKEGVRWIRNSIETSLRNQIYRAGFGPEQTIQIDWDGIKDVITLVE